MKELQWDEPQWEKLLRIKTTGRDDSHSTNTHYPYEPTSYQVLERLAKSGYIGKKNTVIDYGCGKGRVSFFLNHELKCKTIGVEFDERIYLKAEENRRSYGEHQKVGFVCCGAEQFEIEDADVFYFFNPFSVEILQSVMSRILDSYYDKPRHMQLFFYYPNDEYVAYLMTQEILMFVDEIDCRDLFGNEDRREKILIFEMN